MLVATLLILSSATNFSKYHSTHKLRMQKVHSYKNAFCVEFFLAKHFLLALSWRDFIRTDANDQPKIRLPIPLPKDSKTKQDRVIDVSFNTLIQQKFKAHVSRCSIKLNWHRVDCANGIVPLNSWKIVPSVWADYFLNIGC